jgi:prephenate dehydrogenase
MAIQRITVIGTGLIGASVGLALRASGFTGEIAGWNRSDGGMEVSLQMGAISRKLTSEADALKACAESDVIFLAVPVLAILDWMEKLAPHLHAGQLVTDGGSTKLEISRLARTLYNKKDTARFLPGHPMAGKESGGAALAEATLYQNAVWLLTPLDDVVTPVETEWRALVQGFGSRVMDLEAARHDELCAWVSHLPQMVSTALTALLEDSYGDAPDLRAIGGRALREMTRLGSSPYSMWRDIAQSNSGPLAAAMLALEQRLAHLRENLKTTELRDEFDKANRYRGLPAATWTAKKS